MPTMADIAKRAGVALSTVSHTLSGKRPVSAEVRQRVLQAIAELEYQPHALARALATKKTRTIALLYPALSGNLPEPHFEFMSGILEATSLRKYGLLVWTTPNDDQEVLNMIQQGFIDGLVLMEVRLQDSRVTMLKEQNYPFTMIGRSQENEAINFVDLDFDYALERCVEYLTGLRHQHIAFISHSLKLREVGAGYVLRSEQAFNHAMTQRGLNGLSCPCEGNAQAGYEAVNLLLAQNPSLTAIVTPNAWVTGGMIRALNERGLRIPQDISLVGVVSPRVAEMTVPSLTTIDFPFKEMGYMGADMLIRQLEGEQVTTQLLLKPDLTIRQSTSLCIR